MLADDEYKNFVYDKVICKIGFWTGITAFISTTCFGIFQLMQLVGWLNYPLDEILIYSSSLCITVPFLLEVLALHHITKPEKKFWSHAAVIFATIYVVFVVANYVVQLATVIPMTVAGKAGEIALLRQTPHSLFWDYDAIGYIAMGFVTFFLIPLFSAKGFEKKVRLILFAHVLTTPVITLVYFYPTYNNTLLLLASPWIITAPFSMLFIALLFQKLSRSNSTI